MPAEVAPFTGIPRDHFAFFRELEAHNSKKWFTENRERFDAVVATFRSLLARLERPMLALHPDFETGGRIKGNFSNIHRDMRFHPKREPYNTNFYLYFYDARRSRKSDARLYVGIGARAFTFGFSVYAEEKNGALREILRPRLEEDLPALKRWLSRYVKRTRYDSYWYARERQKWVRKDGLPASPEDWQRLTGLVVRKVMRPRHPALSSASLAHEIELTFERLFALYAFSAIEGPGWEKHLSLPPPARAAAS